MGNMQDIITYSQRRLYRAPVTRPNRVLDIRAVSTKWVAEVARRFPGAQVHGMAGSRDPSLLQAKLPPNAYLHDQIAQPGHDNFPSSHFDLIYSMCALRYLPKEQVPNMLSDLYEHAVPGGWVEIWEHMNELHEPGPTAVTLASMLKQYVSSKGGGVAMASSMDVSLRSAGFTQVQLATIHLPIGEWGGTRGTILAEVISVTLRNIADSLIMVEQRIEEGEYFHELISQWEIELSTNQSSLIMYSAIGQRPEGPSSSGARTKQRTVLS